jgi:cysteinyl-tRNA synthetase
MEIKLYNTLSRKKEVFKSIEKGRAGLYFCGPTIYNYVHIGNLRAYVFSDILRRVLEFNGYTVNQVMNLTDVDDKTIRDSINHGISLRKFTETYEKAFKDDISEMNIKNPSIMPRATDHINKMIKIIKILLSKDIAYEAEDGIYFSIKKFPNYGKLSKIKKKELLAGGGKRVSSDEYDKESADDFALWKFYSPEDGDVFWEAPFGKGRPGWHIECSAMSSKYLGNHFDIHAGGVDLIFPHHENEIAQSEASIAKKPWVNYWLHNDYVLVEGKKMSKSLKNFYKLEDVKEKGFSPLDLRYFYLTKIYRQKINFTWGNLKSSQNSLKRLTKIISSLKDDGKENKKYTDEFTTAINDDLNTPNALQVLWKLVRDEKAEGKLKAIKKMDEVLGLDLLKQETIEIPLDVKKLVKERSDARKNKDWKKSDEIRERLKEKGFVVEDNEKGSLIKKIGG